MALVLDQAKALIFRITHRENVRWIMGHGLHSSNSDVQDPNFVPIGNAELIGKRRVKAVPPPHGGLLSDYVPFYFTPSSPMLLNIVTGWNGLPKQEKRDIVVLISSISRLGDEGVQFVFSDRHAYLKAARFSGDPADLTWIDWPLLQARDFKGDPNDPGKQERYEAETLARDHVPVGALAGIACYNDIAAQEISAIVKEAGAATKVVTRAGWFF